MTREYKYPAQLCIGDVLVDAKSKARCVVRDFSAYTVCKFGESYRRLNWVQVDSAIYSPKVLLEKFRGSDNKLEVAGSIPVT